MEIYKIRKKYCSNNEAQIMISNADSQIIYSKDGYYVFNSNGRSHRIHHFKYNQLYVMFSKFSFSYLHYLYSYSLSFLYIHKPLKGPVIFAKLDLNDFAKEDKKERYYDKNGLEEFLYGLSNINGKYIFDLSCGGVKYANSINEGNIIRKKFLDLSDQAIIDLYNYSITPNSDFNKFYRISSKNIDKSKIVTNIGEIREFSITDPKKTYNPLLMLVIKDEEMYVLQFEIIYCERDLFKVISNKINITPNINDILSASVKSSYLPKYPMNC